MMHRSGITEGKLCHQFVGAGAIKSNPVVFPWIILIGRVGDQLAGLSQKNISGMQFINRMVYRISSFSIRHVVNEIVVPHAWSPGVSPFTALQPAIKNRQFDIVRIALFKGLLIRVGHGDNLR